MPESYLEGKAKAYTASGPVQVSIPYLQMKSINVRMLGMPEPTLYTSRSAFQPPSFPSVFVSVHLIVQGTPSLDKRWS